MQNICKTLYGGNHLGEYADSARSPTRDDVVKNESNSQLLTVTFKLNDGDKCMSVRLDAVYKGTQWRTSVEMTQYEYHPWNPFIFDLYVLDSSGNPIHKLSVNDRLYGIYTISGYKQCNLTNNALDKIKQLNDGVWLSTSSISSQDPDSVMSLREDGSGYMFGGGYGIAIDYFSSNGKIKSQYLWLSNNVESDQHSPTKGVRPIIVLKSNVDVNTSSGDGTSTSPYKLYIPED